MICYIFVYTIGFGDSTLPSDFTLECDGNEKEKEGVDYLDKYIDLVVSDTWEFIDVMKFSEFSLVAVSGGGPYALAFLQSYLEKKKDTVTLTSISIVAGLLCSAGIEDMMNTNQQLCQAVQSKSSILQFIIRKQLGFQAFLIKSLPTSWILKMISLMLKYVPEADREILKDETLQETFIEDVEHATKQSCAGYAMYIEAKSIFRPNLAYEASLQKITKEIEKEMPPIHIFHGTVDVNVPISHSKYLKEHVLCGKADLTVFQDLGHISTILGRSDEYVRCVVPE